MRPAGSFRPRCDANINAQRLAAFLLQLDRQLAAPYMIVWDQLQAHRGSIVRDFLINRLVADFEQTQLCSNGPDTNNMSSRLYTDTQVSWKPSGLQDGAWTFSLGINNLFDERPVIVGGLPLLLRRRAGGLGQVAIELDLEPADAGPRIRGL
jgi:hypothetical protein